jgi:hypothetical protein
MITPHVEMAHFSLHKVKGKVDRNGIHKRRKVNKFKAMFKVELFFTFFGLCIRDFQVVFTAFSFVL